MNIIEIEHVTKEFRLGSSTGLREALLNSARRMIGRSLEEASPFKAINDINLVVPRGEVLGIIGHNGAGKSTLLKLLAGISKPTSGRLAVHGRIAPLIEVGAGFVPDFTGRENVYLNGAILGMSRREIDRKFDEIVDFAELAPFIDTPVKRYSSGMQVKLAFSVATSVDAEILIVDEVLAVGDIAFQRKCLNRMENLISSQDRTVLIVGHNIRQLERICSRMILLNHGRIEVDGAPGEVSKRFLDETTLRPEHAEGHVEIRPHVDTGDIELRALEINSGARSGDGFARCSLFEDLHVRMHLFAAHDFNRVEINFGVHNPEMIFMTKSSTSLAQVTIDLKAGLNMVDVVFERIPLCPGTYGIGFAVYDWSRRPLWAANKLAWFTIEADAKDVALLPPSTLTYLPARWSVAPGKLLDPTPASSQLIN